MLGGPTEALAMRIPRSMVLALAAACCLAACQREDAGPTPSPAPAASAPPATATVSAEDAADATARYDCQAGAIVLLLRDGRARALLPGGERYDLSRVAASDPPVYAGSALYFTVDARAAHLSQQDGSRELACTAAAG
jgi:hypothetical protein